jgi:threonyl-tRNA synthetase
MQIAKQTMNRKLYSKIMAARMINPETDQKQIIDLSRPLTESVTIEFIYQDERDGMEVLWHSSAHILGHSLEELYSCLLCTGPVKEHEGFYYDAIPADNVTITTQNLDDIQKTVKKLISQKNEFQRIEISYDQAIEMFQENKFKQELINKHAQNNDNVSVYRVGNLVDF